MASGAIGAPLMMHSAHRNPSCPGTTPATWRSTTPPSTTSTSCAGCSTTRSSRRSVLIPRRNRHAGDLRDPLFVLLEMASGAIVDVEVSVNIALRLRHPWRDRGRDRHGELAESNPVVVKTQARVRRPGAGRLARALRPRLRHRIPGLARRRRQGHRDGPSAWDGYAATAVCDAALEALRTGTRKTVSLRQRPAFYA